MARSSFDHMSCSVARTLDVIGAWWTPLILRDLYYGVSRFDAIQRDLSISRKVLAQRLDALEQHDVVERVAYQDNPPRYDYRLTEKGADLAIVLLALKTWGDRWTVGEDGPPMVLLHDRCGQAAEAVPTCSHCGEALLPDEVTPVPGPGADPGPGTREIYSAIERASAAKA